MNVKKEKVLNLCAVQITKVMVMVVMILVKVMVGFIVMMVMRGFPAGSDGKESACNAGDLGSILGVGRFPWRREWQPTPVILAWRIPWTEDPGRLQSMESQRVGHN